MITNRGFVLKHFNDDNDEDCSIQESSSVEPHIWLGLHKPDICIMYKDLWGNEENIKSQIKFIPKDPEQPYCGWYKVQLPQEIHQFSRMHLNRKQAIKLAKYLIHFAITGRT